MAADRARDEEQFALAHVQFDAREVREHAQGGQRFRYVRTDTVQNRLDDVFGPASWQDHYQIVDDVTAICTLTVTLPDGRVISRQAPGNRKPDSPTLKPGDVGRTWATAFSKALKVAARKFGVGRHLNGPVPHYVGPALERISGQAPPAIAEPPAATALPAPKPEPEPKPAPSFGRRLYNWAAEQGKAQDFDLVRHLTDWGGRQGFPARLVDWSEDEARLGGKEAQRRLASLHSQEVPEDALAN